MANQNRLEQDIETLRNISDPCDGGVTRIGLTPRYRQGVNYIKVQMQAVGLTIREDEVGNVYGIMQGTHPTLPSIISGSHLDTVKNAGAFDGIAGVVCALEVARMLKEQNIQLKHNYEVVAFVEEEGTHFGTVLLGSRYITGELNEVDKDRLRNDEGQTLRQILQQYSTGVTTISAKRDPQTIKAFLELHDEQGPVLEATKTDIGIVDNIVAIGQLVITITGFAGHAGTVPMTMRQDAGIAGCQFVSHLNQYTLRKYAEQATLTVGKFSLSPNSANTIPNQCTFTLDIRSGDEKIVHNIIKHVSSLALIINDEFNVVCEVKQVSFKDPVVMDSGLRQLLQATAEDLGLSVRHLNSGAGHDAMIMSGICPTAMMFIPCYKGITHHPDENVTWQDMAKGTDVLFNTIIQLDKK